LFFLSKHDGPLFWGGEFTKEIFLTQNRRVVQLKSKLIASTVSNKPDIDPPTFEFKICAGTALKSRAQWTKLMVKGNGPVQRSMTRNRLLALFTFLSPWHRAYLSLDDDGLYIFESKSSTAALAFVPTKEMLSLHIEQGVPTRSLGDSRASAFAEDLYNVVIDTKGGDTIYLRLNECSSRVAWHSALETLLNVTKASIATNQSSLSLALAGRTVEAFANRIYQLMGMESPPRTHIGNGPYSPTPSELAKRSLGAGGDTENERRSSPFGAAMNNEVSNSGQTGVDVIGARAGSPTEAEAAARAAPAQRNSWSVSFVDRFSNMRSQGGAGMSASPSSSFIGGSPAPSNGPSPRSSMISLGGSIRSLSSLTSRSSIISTTNSSSPPASNRSSRASMLGSMISIGSASIHSAIATLRDESVAHFNRLDTLKENSQEEDNAEDDEDNNNNSSSSSSDADGDRHDAKSQSHSQSRQSSASEDR
jgi:hypothetical protein